MVGDRIGQEIAERAVLPSYSGRRAVATGLPTAVVRPHRTTGRALRRAAILDELVVYRKGRLAWGGELDRPRWEGAWIWNGPVFPSSDIIRLFRRWTVIDLYFNHSKSRKHDIYAFSCWAYLRENICCCGKTDMYDQAHRLIRVGLEDAVYTIN